MALNLAMLASYDEVKEQLAHWLHAEKEKETTPIRI
jgi:hypothetical protein